MLLHAFCFSVQSPNGDVKVQGPLRIYWGLSRPIQLRHCDDVPALPISKWRHSLYVNLNDNAGQNNNSPLQKVQGQGVSVHVGEVFVISLYLMVGGAPE